MTQNALHNLINRHANIVNIRYVNTKNLYFVDFANISDMESVYRGMENNTLDITMELGRDCQKSKNNEPIMPIPEEPYTVRPRKSAVDMENRTVRISSKQHARVQVNNKKFVQAKDYEKHKLLKDNDPKQQLLVEEDAHFLERDAGLKPNVSNVNTTNQYSKGMAYAPMPSHIKNQMQEFHKRSSGNYDVEFNKYQNNQKHADIKQGPCTQCANVCDLVCSRCKAFFCGLECQQEAWSHHRYICGKPKHLQGNRKALTATSVIQTRSPAPKRHTEMPKSGNLVNITCISKTNVIFIRSKIYEDNLSFFKTVNEVNAAGKEIPTLETPPKCGQIVITEFEGQFNRAMVLNTDNLEQIRVVYIDYGTVDKKSLSELKEAPSKFIDLPRHALPVVLKNVPDVFMTNDIRWFMYHHLDLIDLKIVYQEDDLKDGIYSVQLIDEVTGQNFNKALIKLINPVNNGESFHYSFLKHEFLPYEQKNVELIIMDNSLLSAGCMSCSTKPFVQAIQKFQLELQKYAEEQPEDEYAPCIDGLCIAKYSVDQKWYRGRCMEMVGDGNPTICFFDYGNIATVNVMNIRRYPAHFTFPIFTSDCEIEGLPEQCDEDLIEKLEEMLPNGCTIVCDEIRVDKEANFNTLVMPKIIIQLKQQGFLK